MTITQYAITISMAHVIFSLELRFIILHKFVINYYYKNLSDFQITFLLMIINIIFCK